MYIYFFQTSKYYPSIFYSRNIHPIFPKKNQFPFHQRFNVSLACTFPSKSPDFLSKIVNVSSEFHRSTLSHTAFLSTRTKRCTATNGHRYANSLSLATRYASVALHESRAFSRLDSKTSNKLQFEKAIILVIVVRAILRHSFDRTCNGNIVSSSFANTQTDDDFLTRVEDAFYLFGIGDY